MRNNLKKQVLHVLSFCAILVFLLSALTLTAFAASRDGFSDNSGGGGTRYSVDLAFEDSIVNVQLGRSVQLICYVRPESAAPTLTWSSNNTSVATINASTGVVTGRSVGTATITATAYNPGGTPYSATCTVHVNGFANGVYRIKNSVSTNYTYYLTLDGSINENTGTKLAVYSPAVTPSTSNTTTTFSMLEQYWRIYYVGNGYYSIRSMAKPDMLLTRNGSNVVIKKGSTTDSLSALGLDKLWTITPYGSNYDLRLYGEDDYALMPYGGTVSNGTNIVVGEYYSSIGSMHWTLEAVSNPPEGVLMYDTDTGHVLTTASTRAVVKGESRTLTDLEILPVYYNCDNLSQSGFVWTSSNTSNATVNSSSGKVTGRNNVNTSVNISLSKNSCTAVKYTLHVIPLENGTYFLKTQVPVISGVGYFTPYLTHDSDQTMQLCDFEGNDTQLWSITSKENGYYNITALHHTTNNRISANSSSVNTELSLSVSSSSTKQQWKFIQTSNGEYYIQNKYSGYKMAAVINNGDYLIKQVNDSSQYASNKWIVDHIGSNKYKLLAYDDGAYMHNGFFQNVNSSISDHLGESCYTLCFNDSYWMDKDTMKRLMYDSDIFVIETHGSQTGIQLSNYVTLFNNDMNSMDLSSMRFGLLLCCDTAIGYNPRHITTNRPQNFVEKMICCGAETVIGFSGVIEIDDADEFAKSLFEEMFESNSSVSNAVDNIDCSEYINTNLKSLAVIAGNGNLVLTVD